MTEYEMVGWHHQLDGHEFEKDPKVDGGKGSLACCSPWGHRESDTTAIHQIHTCSLAGGDLSEYSHWL